jgi:hypothetical protein
VVAAADGAADLVALEEEAPAMLVLLVLLGLWLLAARAAMTA